jgi:anaerobic magnesium-protoporphyrin IX monomethyl ester cyclase
VAGALTHCAALPVAGNASWSLHVHILLVNTNRERRPHPVVPIGLACVAQALERAGHEVGICDLTFARHPQAAIARAVRTVQPGMVGLSIRNLDNSTYAAPHSYLDELRAIAGYCREASKAPLVIGGSAVGIAPRELLAELHADWAVAGDGEAAATALAAGLQRHERLTQFPGVMGAGDAEWVQPAGELGPALLGSLPRYVHLSPYLQRGAALPIQTRRGCAFRCAYCTYPAIEGSAYRLKEPEAVVAEMDELQRVTGSRCFEFVDSTYNAPLHYAQALSELLARRPQQRHLQAAGFTPAQSSPELLAAMRRAGFRTVVCSPDSASDTVLQALGKGFVRDDLERLVDRVHRAGIVTLWSFIFGGPGENEATARDTLRFIAQRLSATDLVLIAVGPRIYPGTPLERLARAEGLLAPGEDLLAPRFYLSPHLSLPRLGRLFDAWLPGARNCVFLSDLQHGLVPWLERALTVLHLPPPLWRYAPYWRRIAPRRPHVLPQEPQ